MKIQLDQHYISKKGDECFFVYGTRLTKKLHDDGFDDYLRDQSINLNKPVAAYMWKFKMDNTESSRRMPFTGVMEIHEYENMFCDIDCFRTSNVILFEKKNKKQIMKMLNKDTWIYEELKKVSIQQKNDIVQSFREELLLDVDLSEYATPEKPIESFSLLKVPGGGKFDHTGIATDYKK